MKIECKAVLLSYSAIAGPVLDGFDLAVRAGEFVCIVGPSGCGKSTLIHLLAGFIKTSSGQVLKDGRALHAPGPDRAVVFQKHNLFPWQSALENVTLSLQAQGHSRALALDKALRHLESVGLGTDARKYPHELSLGMQQRVGLARAFALPSDVLLMDEPFASLDARTKLRMQALLLEIWRNDRKTVIFVTHDIDEALLLADRIIVIGEKPARVQAEIALPIPRPRTLHALTDQIALQAKERILDLLEPEFVARGF